jgi:alpha-galactosidase
MRHKISMLGAGSLGFSYAVAATLVKSEVFSDSVFSLMDIDKTKLAISAERVKKLFKEKRSSITVETTLDRVQSLDGADFVVTACEPHRYPFWLQDIEIPEKYGAYQLKGENGGPGGQIHAMRNITMFSGICKDIRRICPDAWLLNFTNPMSFLCTYFERYGGVKYLGFCHQVHGSFGVIAEELGMEPGDLEVISGGVNHFNWLMDIRKKNSSRSYMNEFLQKVRKSIYWKKIYKNIPEQKFTLELLDIFGTYPVGYDNHILEYIPFFYERDEWEKLGFTPQKYGLKRFIQMKLQESKGVRGEVKTEKPPFPQDPAHPYYDESPVKVAEALLTNRPLYLDAINIVNHGSISNLPYDAIVDIPAVVVGGKARGIYVGELPAGCAELCRRQITIHEMVVEAAVKADYKLALQAMSLDPYIRSVTQARKILDDYLKTYKGYLPQFA